MFPDAIISVLQMLEAVAARAGNQNNNCMMDVCMFPSETAAD
ncbi:Hypothetical protein OINT_2000905 [Brucella intermedia LMG 3301]|uniref:Uncharacterized protein n=1 Tax=Brucella intermedia LMG 3301 TaxID=641118 RepID=C4WM34_9HYPH|nr:Hypothetical protein OINT_2000905 [Brucella intermedia LMG 3301]